MAAPVNQAALISFVADKAARPDRWRLSPADTEILWGSGNLSESSQWAEEDLVVEGYPQDDVAFTSSVEMLASAGVGDSDESNNPGIGRGSMSLQTVVQAEHAWHDIRPVRARLERLIAWDPALNRRPLMLFSHQDQKILVWVSQLDIKAVGGSFLVSGLPKRYEVSIAITRARQRRLDDARQGTEPSTFYHVFRATETYEDLALWYLGNPELGPLIRRDVANLDVEEGGGGTVRILPVANSYMRQEVRPMAPCFATDHRTGEGWEDSFEALAQARMVEA